MALSQGSILENRYKIDDILGQGGMGTVYRAWDTHLALAVAVKENLITDPDSQRQFSREAWMLAKLSHPNLPRVADYFATFNKNQYMVMDFVEGEDLDSMVKRLGPLPEAQVIAWILQVCEALCYLHNRPSPVIHRDIKPANIRIRADGRAILVDFGIAKIFVNNQSTTSGAKAVAPGFSPLEQYGGNTDMRSDIYALGATMYHLLTGQTPPDSVARITNGTPITRPRQLNPQISARIEWAVLKALEVDTAQRFQSATEFANALSTARQDAPAFMPVQPVISPAPVQRTFREQLTLGLGKLGCMVGPIGILVAVGTIALTQVGILAAPPAATKIAAATPASTVSAGQPTGLPPSTSLPSTSAVPATPAVPTPVPATSTPVPTAMPLPPTVTSRPTAAPTATPTPIPPPQVADNFDGGLNPPWEIVYGSIGTTNGRLTLVGTSEKKASGVVMLGDPRWNDFAIEFDVSNYIDGKRCQQYLVDCYSPDEWMNQTLIWDSTAGNSRMAILVNIDPPSSRKGGGVSEGFIVGEQMVGWGTFDFTKGWTAVPGASLVGTSDLPADSRHFRIEKRGKNYQVFANGKQISQYSITLPAGKIGVWFGKTNYWSGSDAYAVPLVDNFTITSLP